MPDRRDSVLNAANLLTFYRLAMAPVIAALALGEQRNWFIILLCISFATDVLDGLIARAWNLSTDFGSRLDSVADELTYVAALVGIFQFEYEALKPHVLMLYAFIALLLPVTLIPLIRFGKTPSFHLYSFKANALLQGIFILYLFTFGFSPLLYYFVMAFGILACIEAIAVALLVRAPVCDARSLFWVLRGGNRSR